MTSDRTGGDVIARVREMTGGHGVDRIVEVDFAANMATDAALIRPNGWIAAYSSSSNPRPVLDHYAFQGKGANLRFVQGFNLPEAARAAAEAFIAAHAGALAVAIRAVLPLEDIAAAHRLVEGGGGGNIVLRPAG